MKLAVVKISDIIVENRFREDYGNLHELAHSIKKEGIIQPLAVKQTDLDPKPRLLAGGRRLEAAKLAGLDEVPVRIYDQELSQLEMRSIELMENLCRKEMSYVEEVRLKREIAELQIAIHGRKISTAPGAEGTSDRETAKLLGVSPASLSQDKLLAQAIDIMPELGNMKTKAEAYKALRQIERDIKNAKQAERLLSRPEVENSRTKEFLRNAYVVGDFFERVKTLPDESFDLIEVDPPYAIDAMEIRNVSDDLRLDYMKYNEVPKDMYPVFIRRVAEAILPKLVTNGWVIWWFGDTWKHQVYAVLTDVGFIGNPLPAIWTKATGQTTNPNYVLASAWEPFYYMRKGPNAHVVRGGRSNVFNYKGVAPTSRIHPTERPIEMIQDVLSTFAHPGANILVPFLGSGNTLLAAWNNKQTAIGFELTKEYKDRYVIRVANNPEGEPFSSYPRKEKDEEKK